MNIKTILFIAALSAGNYAEGQTAKWAVRPTSAQLEGYGHLLKIRKNGKMGLIDHDSREVVPARYDSISPFRDGYALAMTVSGKSLRIDAVISDGDYEVQPLTETVYATRYMWFSDGKMPVRGSGGWGYLGTDGNMVIPCQFQTAYPFSEGFASVMIDDKAYYIDRNMDYLPVEAGYGNLVFASTFSGDEAVVYSGNSYTPKGYVINQRGRIVRPYKVKPDALQVNNYDHSIGDRTRRFNEQVDQLPVDNQYTVFSEGSLYGYKKNGMTVLPAQLERAEPVRGGYANVRYKGFNGVLRMVDGKVNINLDNSSVEVADRQAASGWLTLHLPAAMEDAAIRLRMVDGQGGDMLVQPHVSQGMRRTFSFRPQHLPQASGSDECRIEVWSDNLLLLRKPCSVSYVVKAKPVEVKAEKREDAKPELRIASLSVAPPRASSKRANPKNDFYVTVAVSNSGDLRGNAAVSLYVDGQPVGSKNVSVRGHGSANAIFAVSNIRKERYAKVKATLKNGRSSQEANMHFLPFY